MRRKASGACALVTLLGFLGASGCTSPIPAGKVEREAPSQAGEDLLRWWAVVESVGTHGTLAERDMRLSIRLDSLSDEDFRSFVAFYVDRLAVADRESLWRAATAAFGECNDEFFGWLRAEVIFRGRAEYERILGGDATFADYGDGPTGDPGAALWNHWSGRFLREPHPAPRVAAPPGEARARPPGDDEVQREPEEHEALQTPPPRTIPPPTGVPTFCMDMNPEVPRFVGVPIDGRACADVVYVSAQPPPAPTVPFERRRLCHRLRRLSGADGEDGSDWCELAYALPDGYAIYSVGSASLEGHFLVHLRGERAEIVASLGTYSSGVLGVYEEMRGHHFAQQPSAVTVTWRRATVDWDLGVDEVELGEFCQAIRCEREGRGHLCSLPITLRTYGGQYTVDREPGRVLVGEPKEQWDCRGR